MPRSVCDRHARATAALGGSPAAGSSGSRSTRRRARPRRRVLRSATSGSATCRVAPWASGKRNAAWARPAWQRSDWGNASPASPPNTAAAESPWRKVEPVARDGGLGNSNAGRPSTVTVRSCSAMRSTTASPSGLYGRTANAIATGRRDAFSISTTTSSSSACTA